MAKVNEKKLQNVIDDATSAWVDGRYVFTPVLTYPGWSQGYSGGNEEITAMIEAILSLGWILDTWGVTTDYSGRPQAVPLFVRPGFSARG